MIGSAIGCGGGPVQEEIIEVKNNDPLRQVKQTLMNYVKGQPLTSEVASFDYMIEDVKKVDPAKAAILKVGLDDIKTTKGSPAAKAKALLKKLGLDESTK